MKLSKFLLGVAICTTSSLLWVSCKKSDIVPQTNNQVTNSANIKMTGVAPDDPAKVAKVPVLISADFLKITKEALLADPLTSLNGPVSTQASKGGKSGGDKTAPTVSITSPSNSATVSGTVTIQVSASDNVGVSQVNVSIDGIALGSSTTAPYSFSWNTSGVTSGTHTISATAKDAAGNSSSTSIQVGINATVSGDVTAPTVSITSPASGSSVSAGATVTVAVSASDNVGVSSVSFSVDGTLQNSSSSSPYSFTWNTTGVASGTHTLTATARDAAGNSTSYSILITVNTTVISSTTLPSSVLLAMPPVGYQGSEGSCVAFAVGYAARSCEQYYRSSASSFSLSTNIFSPAFIFNQIQMGSCSSSSILTALDFIVSKGVCTWNTMPYDYNSGCSLQPNSSQLSEAANYKISSYSSVYTSDITTMKTMLANKHPLSIAIAIDNNFNNAGPGYVWKSYDGSGSYGAHAVTICGYDDAMHAYKAINSWGTSWSSGGYIWIDYDFLPIVKSNCYVMN